jgi:hypothetical protein
MNELWLCLPGMAVRSDGSIVLMPYWVKLALSDSPERPVGPTAAPANEPNDVAR